MCMPYRRNVKPKKQNKKIGMIKMARGINMGHSIRLGGIIQNGILAKRTNMLKLITETSTEIESLIENTTSGKKYMLEGLFAVGDTKNANGRIYESKVL